MAPDGGVIANRSDISSECGTYRIDSRLIGRIPEKAKPRLIAAAKKENLAGGTLEITEAMVAFHNR